VTGFRARLLALDIDGTLLGPDGEVAPGAREAVQRAQRAGLRVVLCTGRRFRTALPVQQALGLEGPIVLHNGALVKDSASGRTLSAVTLASELCRETIAALRPHGPPIVYVDRWPHADFVTERGPSHPTQAEYLAEHRSNCEFVEDLARESLDGVLMVSVMADAATVAQLGARAAQTLGPRIHRHEIHNHGYGGQILELLAPGSGKWPGLLRLAEGWGIGAQEIAAVGDDLNDLELVREAGLGIAMGNAVAAVRRAADRVAPGHAEGGVARAIEMVLEAR
jgi:Cof subfamily protein (haloacid dehalogenase superfamily)